MDVAGGFVDVEDFSVNGDEDGAVGRGGKFDDEVRRQRVGMFEDDFGEDFAADTFFLPAGREFAAAGDFFGQAGREAFAFFAGGVGADGVAFRRAEGDVDLDG